MWSLGFMRAATLCNMALEQSLPEIRKNYGERIDESRIRDAIGAERIMDEWIRIQEELTKTSIFEQDPIIIQRLANKIPELYKEYVTNTKETIQEKLT